MKMMDFKDVTMQGKILFNFIRQSLLAVLFDVLLLLSSIFSYTPTSKYTTTGNVCRAWLQTNNGWRKIYPGKFPENIKVNFPVNILCAFKLMNVS